MKEAESFTGLEAVRKIIADMIYGPAIIVMARGRIVRFMALVLAFLQRLAQAGIIDAGRQYPQYVHHGAADRDLAVACRRLLP
jgi:hypothetical protein